MFYLFALDNMELKQPIFQKDFPFDFQSPFQKEPVKH